MTRDLALRVASSQEAATHGGAPSAVAMAVSKGWSKLVLPAMLIGIWGYVIGTLLGVSTTKLLHWISGISG